MDRGCWGVASRRGRCGDPRAGDVFASRLALALSRKTHLRYYVNFRRSSAQRQAFAVYQSQSQKSSQSADRIDESSRPISGSGSGSGMVGRESWGAFMQADFAARSSRH